MNCGWRWLVKGGEGGDGPEQRCNVYAIFLF